MKLQDCPTPALIVDLDILERNLETMASKARRLGVALRPHIKTHKCIEIARMQVAAGCDGITVSTLPEARIFGESGFNDITWAFPVIIGRLEEAIAIARRVRLGLTVDSDSAIDALEGTGHPLEVWLKVDCGYHRAGVQPEDPASRALAHRLGASRNLTFRGLLTHSGHAYQAENRLAGRRIAEEERSVMASFAERLRGEGLEVPDVSVGSTPAMSQAPTLEGVTEARPGNYAFYDSSQVRLGSCTVADCAVTVLSTVVSSRPGSSKAVVDAGALALSKDPGIHRDHLPETCGDVFEDYPAGQLSADARLVSLSQEHGILSQERPVGSLVRILPNHSCLTVACFDEYHVVRGDQVIDRWKIQRSR